MTVSQPTPPLRMRLEQLGRDAIALTKPRVISLLLLTTFAAMFITPAGMPALQTILLTMIGGYLMAGGANAVNMAYDSDIDSIMGRTAKRPVPSGRVSKQTAYLFGFLLMALSFAVLAFGVNWLSAWLAFAGFIYYTVIYTAWLKRRTSQNIVIGGGAGAIPPLVGWAAASGSLDLTAAILFIIIFMWTPPHFWALALMMRMRNDYGSAGVPMLPVVATEAETTRQIWIYSWVLIAITLILVALGQMGWIYLLVACAVGAVFLLRAWQLHKNCSQKRAFDLYKYSLLYLALLFVGMAADRMLL
ncbi:MAG: heme o synthase [Anaerolineae bacterium]|nr:heme o synthase [Anaerolineae bacterium]